MLDVRPLEESEYRSAHTLFRAAVHNAPAEDQAWEHARPTYQPGRAFGCFDGGTLIGTTMSTLMPLVIPGGAAVPMTAVSRVGVRADKIRRGVLTALMREQLAAAGEPVATLRASEYPIYGRFGYGVASRGRWVIIDRNRPAMHPNVPTGGEVRLIDRDQYPTVLPALYRRIDSRRPGTLQRTPEWWEVILHRPSSGGPTVVAVHTGPDGDDGFAVYCTAKNPTADDPWGLALEVDDLHAASLPALAGLWRFLLRVDLINEVRAWMRPLDEPIELLLATPRACRTTNIKDETWLRLVDLPAALNARSWGEADPVVIGVRDVLLPANDGNYLITPDGVKRTDEPAQLELTVAELGRLYLGDLAPSALAATGWLTVRDADALPHADALFATGIVPWSGTYF